MFLRAPWIFFLYKWTPFFFSLYFCHSEKKLVTPYLFGDFILFFIYFCLFSFEWRIIHAKKKTKYKKASTVWMNPGTEKEVIMYKCKRYGQREDETSKWSESDKAEVIFRRGFANRAARVRTCFCWQSVFVFYYHAQTHTGLARIFSWPPSLFKLLVSHSYLSHRKPHKGKLVMFISTFFLLMRLCNVCM